ncbi:MAG TPA: hypothetical protein VJT67_00435, partial [Longimicrobiaceae bacterium]|nr:hypothetical protein [Longimicrobiaceae bacterium]
PSEDAGGEVRYRTPGAGPRAPLLALQGEFYRRHEGDRFYHRRLVFAEWSIDPAPLLADSLLPAWFEPQPGGIPMRGGGRARRH